MSTPQDPQRPYDPESGAAPQDPAAPGQQPAGSVPQNPAAPGQQPAGGAPYQQGGYDPNAQPGYPQNQDPNAQPPSLNKAPGDPYGSAGSAGSGFGSAPQDQPGFQQGQPGAFPQGAPAGFQPTEPPAKNKNRNIAVAVAVVVVAAVIGFFVWQSQKDDTKNADPGACINVITASATDAKTEQIDCGDPKAGYVVTERGNGITCEEKETSYTEGKTIVCMRPNMKVGDCAKVGDSAANGDMEKIDCASATDEDVKLALLDTASADPKKCSEDQLALDLPKRNIVYCFAAAKS